VKVMASRTVVAFAPEAPLRFSLPTLVDSRGNPLDLATVRLVDPIQQNQEYSLVSAVSTATVQELRTAGEDYPDWVRERYLQLPRRTPREVLEVARDATNDVTAAYDKAIGIETYLRDNFTYATTVPNVPPDRDWVEFFLFESKQGYCDYFATAMVVMLRTQGVPARVASGFAPGEFDESAGLSLVRENHAHSWVEVYFPRDGWIVFEPSSIRPLPLRLDQPIEPQAPPPSSGGDLSTDANALSLQELEELLALQCGGGAVAQPEQTGLPGWLVVILFGLLGVLVAAMLLAGGVAIAWRSGLGRLAAYQQPYAQLLRVSRWLGKLRQEPADTPYEAAESVARQVPQARPAIRELTAAYVEGTYAGRPPSTDPWPTWLAARRDILRGMLRHRLRSWFGEDTSAPTPPRAHPELLQRWGAGRHRDQR
jgi:hypothetical protein